MSAFEPRDWHSLDMETKVRLFSLKFPPHRVLRTLALDEPPLSPPRLVRHDTSIGGWVAERACPYAPIKRRVTFQEPPPWHLERHDTSIGGWVAERA
jgi:hypothetical protein